jgi:hypothetical protein
MRPPEDKKTDPKKSSDSVLGLSNRKLASVNAVFYFDEVILNSLGVQFCKIFNRQSAT